MGDFLACCSLAVDAAGAGPEDEPDGRPGISSSSVTTNPRAVISLRRMIRLWGKRPFDV